MNRCLPQPWLSGFLWLMWLLLVGDWSIGHVLLGAVLGVAIPYIARAFDVNAPPVHRPVLLLRLIGRVLGDIVLANGQVVRRVIGRMDALQPAFVEVPLCLRSDLALTILTSIVTLTPGTVSAVLSVDRRTLLVHGLDVPDDAALISEIQQRYEAPLREIFECSTS